MSSKSMYTPYSENHLVHSSLSSSPTPSPSPILLPLVSSISALPHFLTLGAFSLTETAAASLSSLILVSTELLERYVIPIFPLITSLQALNGGFFCKDVSSVYSGKCKLLRHAHPITAFCNSLHSFPSFAFSLIS